MSKITPTQKATVRHSNTSTDGPIGGKGDARNVKTLVSTVEAAIQTAAGNTLLFGYVPSDARPVFSMAYWDDLATAGSPTLDIGLASDNVTADPDAITNGLAVSSAGNSAVAFGDPAFVGVPFWDLVNGVTADPREPMQVYGTLADAATTTVGTVTYVLGYTLD